MKTLLRFLLLSHAVFALAAAAAPTGVWATFYSTDIPRYAANLRAAGCPEETVGVIISQEVNARFKAREEQLQPSTVTVKSLRADFSPERREALVQLRLEKNAVLRAALGVVPQETARIDWSPTALARLAPAQRDIVRMITDDYDVMIARVMTESFGHLLEEDREKLRFLEAERSVDLGQWLTPDEVTDFELAKTSFGRFVRTELKLFDPTPEQLRTYFRLGKKHGIEIEGLGRNLARIMESQRALRADLAEEWGPETYARYRRAISLQYSQILNLVHRLGLDESVVLEIFNAQKDTTEQGFALYEAMRPSRPPGAGGASAAQAVSADRIMVSTSSGPPLGPRAALGDKLKALVAAHCDFVTTRLGEAGFKEYFELNRQWLTSMQNGGAVRLSYSLP
jgi:hypothetical protein